MRQRILAVLTNGVARWATDRRGPSRCRFFREAIIGVFKEPGPALHYCRPVNGGGAQVVGSSDPDYFVAGSGAGNRCRRLEVSLPNWKTVKRRFVCLRQEIVERPQASDRRLSGVHVPGDGDQRALWR